jgi:hypothetical protein
MLHTGLKKPLDCYGPQHRLCYVRFTPAASPAAQVLTEAQGITGVTRTGAGAFTVAFADKPKAVIPLGAHAIENDTTHLHQVRVESTNAAAGTAAVTHKASAAADATYSPTHFISATIPDVSVADTYYMVAPVAGDIVNMRTIVDGAISNQNVTLTGGINGTPITDGVVTIATGGAAGDRDIATPSAANTVAAGDSIELVCNGNGTTADGVRCEVVLEIQGAAATVASGGLTASAASDTVDELYLAFLVRVAA